MGWSRVALRVDSKMTFDSSTEGADLKFGNYQLIGS